MAKRRRRLKLYVWENVLSDHTSGMACVLAYSEEHAWALLKKKDLYDWADIRESLQWHDRVDNRRCEDLPAHIRPKVYSSPVALSVSGGG